jgi:hypothetical protein
VVDLLLTNKVQIDLQARVLEQDPSTYTNEQEYLITCNNAKLLYDLKPRMHFCFSRIPRNYLNEARQKANKMVKHVCRP